MRGGTWSGVVSTRVRRPGLLVFGVFTMLVINLIGPAFPLLWAIVGSIALLWFVLKNLQVTGMIVLLIGMLMNLVPLVFNGATPVSDLALVSVGQVNDAGQADITGLRESTDTASTFSAFGDVVPVPLFNTVVSIGDLIMLVALADIITNLMLRARQRENADSAAIESVGVEPETENEVIAIESPLSRSVKNRPAHAAHRRPRRKSAPSNHVPAHAKNPDEVFGLAPALPDEFDLADEASNVEAVDTTAEVEQVAAVELRDVDTPTCLLYTSPSPRDATLSRMPSSA